MKKFIMFSFLFCGCINIYGQESITDTTETDIMVQGEIVKGWNEFFYPYLDPIWIELIELYEEYETECFNDSTLVISGGGPEVYLRKTTLDSLGRKVLDLTEIISVPAIYIIKKEWVHVQPSFIGFMQYLKKKR